MRSIRPAVARVDATFISKLGCAAPTVSRGALAIALSVAMPSFAHAQATTPPPADPSADTTQSVTTPAPTTNTPSTSNPASTRTPGGSTERPTEDVGGQQATPPGTPEEPSNEIVVTGFRASLANAVREKRNADQIVESVSAEDIGKLPDNSIAESIARLPGLTAQRVDGRDQAISIRGLSPDFTTTLLNGREQVTTGDNRAVEFDQYPSELIGQVVVYKTPTAGLVGQGLAGTVDMRTIRPLEYGKRVLAGNVRGEKVQYGKLNAGTDDRGFRASGTYVDQFLDNTLGVTIGVAHTESPTQYKNYNAWGYPTFDCLSNPAYNTGGTAPVCKPEYQDAQGKYVLGGAKPFVQSEELNRTGVIGTIEWEPSSNFTSTLDGYYTKFKDKQILRGIELPLYWGQGGTNAVTLQPGYTVDGDTITSGTFSNVKGVVRNDENTRNDDLYAFGWNGKYSADKWTIVGDVSYSGVTRHDQYIETYAGTSRGNQNGPYDTLSFSQGPNTTVFSSTLDYADQSLIKLTDPQGWGSDAAGQSGYDNEPKTKDHLWAFRGSVSRDLGLSGLKSIEVGGNYTMRHKTYTPDEFLLELKAYEADPTQTAGVPIPDDVYDGTTKLSYLGIDGMVSVNPTALLNSGTLDFVRNANTDISVKGWSLDENVGTGWLRLNIDQPVGPGALTGNMGVQVVYTDQSSTGLLSLAGTPGEANEFTEGRKYTEVLPSMNLSFRVDDKNVFRFGAARELARARMDQLKAAFNYSYNTANIGRYDPSTGTSFFSGSGGNALLKPWIADAVDASYEHYFGRSAYVAVAGYYKYLESYIYSQTVIQDFSGLNITLPAGVTLDPAKNDYLGFVTQPVNGTGGQIYGVEASGTLPFGDFVHALDGFGLLGSYSYTKSNIVGNPGSPSTPLPGLSKQVWNGTLYFEKWGFSARGSVRHRSGFLAQVVGLGVSPVNQLARGETIVDAQIGYDFKSGFLKGLGILVQGNNLTDERFATYNVGQPKQTIIYQKYGRRYLAGLSYKF